MFSSESFLIRRDLGGEFPGVVCLGDALRTFCFVGVSPRFSETLAGLICFMKGIEGSGRSSNQNVSLDSLGFPLLSLAHFFVSRQPSPKKLLHAPGTNQSGRARR